MAKENLISIENMYRESEKYSRAYSQKAYLNDCIRNGDVESVARFLDMTEDRKHDFESIVQEDIRYAQDMIISQLTYLSDYSLEAGLDSGQVEKLNRFFCREIHNAYTTHQLLRISRDMSITYTLRIKDALNTGKNLAYSPFVLRCLKYISNNIFEDFTVETIASAMEVSTSHLQRRIKDETGSTLKELILQKKIEQAKYLISYTDNTLAEISLSLHFSSQSHFTACFKRITGLTPFVFRNKIQPPTSVK